LSLTHAGLEACALFSGQQAIERWMNYSLHIILGAHFNIVIKTQTLRYTVPYKSLQGF
jgi:hypothetical protein